MGLSREGARVWVWSGETSVGGAGVAVRGLESAGCKALARRAQRWDSEASAHGATKAAAYGTSTGAAERVAVAHPIDPGRETCCFALVGVACDEAARGAYFRAASRISPRQLSPARVNGDKLMRAWQPQHAE